MAPEARDTGEGLASTARSSAFGSRGESDESWDEVHVRSGIAENELANQQGLRAPLPVVDEEAPK